MIGFLRRRNQGSEPGGLVVGVCQSGAPLILPRPSGDPQHVLVSGTTGAGKSVFQRAWAGELAGLEDVAIIGLDPKRTALGMWEPRFTYVAKTIAGCTRVLVWLWAENERRLDVMEAAGVDEWHPDLDGSPFIVVLIDELVQVSAVDGSELVQFMIDPTDLTNHNPTALGDRSKHLATAMRSASTGQKAQGIFLSYLARLCRSSGIQIVAATQYPMSEVVDPQVRANLGLRVMLRVPSNEMVKVCLGDGQHDDITADSISYDERGGCWVAGLGGRPIRARGFDVTTTDGVPELKRLLGCVGPCRTCLSAKTYTTTTPTVWLLLGRRRRPSRSVSVGKGQSRQTPPRQHQRMRRVRCR